MQASALYSTIKMMHSPINIRFSFIHSFIHHSLTLNNLGKQVVKTCPTYLNQNNIVFQHPLVTLPIKLYLPFTQEPGSQPAS